MLCLLSKTRKRSDVEGKNKKTKLYFLRLVKESGLNKMRAAQLLCWSDYAVKKSINCDKYQDKYLRMRLEILKKSVFKNNLINWKN